MPIAKPASNERLETAKKFVSPIGNNCEIATMSISNPAKKKFAEIGIVACLQPQPTLPDTNCRCEWDGETCIGS
jgi:hypothetical protein